LTLEAKEKILHDYAFIDISLDADIVYAVYFGEEAIPINSLNMLEIIRGELQKLVKFIRFDGFNY
jgi:hypothetical protein